MPMHPRRSVAVRDYERKARSALRFFGRGMENEQRPFPLYSCGLNALAVSLRLSFRIVQNEKFRDFLFNYYEIENRRIVTAKAIAR